MNFSYNENAWITGYKGFIGSSLYKKFKKNYNVFPVYRGDKIKNNILNKKNKKYYYDTNKNYLLHLATNYNPRPKNLDEKITILKDNLFFGLELLNSFKVNYFKKILITQSFTEYYNNNEMTLYAKSKNLFSREIQEYYDKVLIKVYLFDTFGIGDQRKKIIEIWLKNLLMNKDITIYSKNSKINLSERNFIVNILSNFKNINAGSYEIRSGFDISLGDLALFLKEITHSKSKIMIKNKNYVKLPKKNKNLANLLKIKYSHENFKHDIKKLIDYYENEL